MSLDTTGPCGHLEYVHGGKMCMLLYGHSCEPHIGGNLYAIPAGLVAPELEEQLFADIFAAREWHKKSDEREWWLRVAPPRFAKVDIDTLNQPAGIRQHLDSWIARFHNTDTGGALILLGPVGSGKTWAAMAVARAAADGCCSITLVSAGQMFRSLRPDGDATLDKYVAPELLLIDDLGVEKPSEWTTETLFAIIDERWRDSAATIITSNLAPSDLRAVVGERVYDRIRDGATALTLTGPSRRAGSISPMAAS